jgi:hypothetical protein
LNQSGANDSRSGSVDRVWTPYSVTTRAARIVRALLLALDVGAHAP